MLTKDTAICIRTTDYSETSQIATFFARAAGKVDVIAKGSKRPKSAFGGALEVFSCGSIVFSDTGKEKLATLTEFVSQADFSSLSNNQFGMNCAYFAIELVNNLTQNYDPHPELFDGLVKFLENIQESKENLNRLRLLILFQLTLLKEVGLQPVLSICVNCKHNFGQDWADYFFSSSANGLICADCEGNFHDKIKLIKQTANVLNNFKLLAESNEKTLSELEKVLIFHFTEIIGRPPKMAKYLLK